MFAVHPSMFAEYIRLTVSRLGLPSEYDYWLPSIRRLSRKRVSPLVISRLKLKPYFQGAIRTLPSIKLQVNDFGGCKDKVKLPLS